MSWATCGRCGYVIPPANQPYAYAGPVCGCHLVMPARIVLPETDPDLLKQLQEAGPGQIIEVSKGQDMKETAPGNAPKVTITDIEKKIASTEYHIFHGVLTICIIKTTSGFLATGESACVSPENFNKALGEKYAYEQAIDKLWAHEGYMLRDQLSKAQ